MVTTLRPVERRSRAPIRLPRAPMTVDQVAAALLDHFFQGAQDPRDVAAGQYHGGNAEIPGLLGEGTLHKTHQGQIHAALQPAQQGENVGLGAAGVTAGNQMG